MVVYPVSQGRLINVVIFLHNRGAFGTPFKGRWVVDVSEQEVLDQFEDWEVHCRALAKVFDTFASLAATFFLMTHYSASSDRRDGHYIPSGRCPVM